MHVTFIPPDLHWLLRGSEIIKRGECYANAGSLVIYSSFDNEISQWLESNSWSVTYTLGILTPPPRDENFKMEYELTPEPHAWIEAQHKSGKTYWWDSTLQQNSPVWGIRSREFKYDKHLSMSAEDLKSWFRETYIGSEFSDVGIPLCDCRFPKIDLEGVVS
ncbi:hypothetical protein KV580_00870 [Pseudomonas chlororaphis]|nr:hypothetical protein [Pseudomonas chlororaphis]